MSELKPIDWTKCTFEGAEREQLRVWRKLSIRQKLEALEEMCDLGRRTLEGRKNRGLAYIDPFTGQLVRPIQTDTAPAA